jgi:hypothetical protein
MAFQKNRFELVEGQRYTFECFGPAVTGVFRGWLDMGRAMNPFLVVEVRVVGTTVARTEYWNPALIYRIQSA